MSDLEWLRQELDRLRNEKERIRLELEHRPRNQPVRSETFARGVESVDFLCGIENALWHMGSTVFFAELRTHSSDILKLVALCEDDAREAGPLVENDAHWLGNRIRKLL